ncbi:DEAD/DEAH box helicase [Staphylococcus simulans]|uniref:DEAD/DEAH box helicase n=1 Tax=Staphylococcus simulans TaxID=1286 RepID=UPI000E681DB3|nr:DEAD/DEAH box helicase [Staphylococcus simulans]RIN77814.1 DEAD/DEAH box helicase [Staphylococcus simulans]
MTSFKLYDYQLELVDKARKLFNETDGVLIQSPPGSGKSVMIAEIVKNAAQRRNRVLFIVHRRELIFQITNTLNRHGVDLSQVDIYSEKRAKNNLHAIQTPAIILTDETHHSRAQTYKDIYNYFDKALRLGFTATPWRASGDGFTDIYPHMVEGPSVRWLIDNQKLAPYKYKSVVLADTKKLKKNSTGDYTKKSMDDAIPKAIYGNIVENYRKFADGQKTILYAHSVEASKAIAYQFEHQGINAVHADANTPATKREQIMNDFRDGHIKVLCNVDLISEGFDVPDCTCVILARPTDSLVLYMQQAMRSMRYQPDKVATIIDHVGNYARHNLPDYPHNWNKYFKGHKKKKNKADDAPSLTTCDECYTVYESEKTACPACGHVNETEVKESEMEHVEAELTEIDPFEIDYTLVKYSKSNIDKSELKTLEDYYLYAKANGYKETWIKFNYPTFRAARITFPAFYAELKPIKQKYNY